MSDGTEWNDDPSRRKHQWRVQAQQGDQDITAYTGNEYHDMIRRVGEMCLSFHMHTVQVYRDEALYRHIGVQSEQTQEETTQEA